MVRTYEEIENVIFKIRKDLIAGIREALKEKGYGINDTVLGECVGECVNVKVDRDWDHIVVCDKREDCDTYYHADRCSVDTLLEAYRTALRAWPQPRLINNQTGDYRSH